MKLMKKTAIYDAFGLRIRSEIELPELLAAASSEAFSDVEIELAKPEFTWPNWEQTQDHYFVHGAKLFFYIHEVASFCIQEGKRITVAPCENMDEGKLRLYLLGTCIGALLLQRKQLPLHGSAIAIDGKAYAFVGDSGAGKSTLAAAFIDRGYPLLSDDVIALKEPESGAAGASMVMPSYPQQKLWQQSVEQLGRKSQLYKPLAYSVDKFAIPLYSRFLSYPLPLAAVFELSRTEANAVSLSQLHSLAKLPVLLNHTFRHFLIAPLKLQNWHFAAAVRLAASVQAYQLQRPAEGAFSAYEMVDLILAATQKGREANV
ncbi:aldolase [Paenibacillus sp. KS-LC4]|uniref:HPr kinase/phosphorylase n=1 Tax=Paenibacillus sp. KS-LC4 TaxID=2979727 RepID=UPI0030CEEFB2